MASESKISDIKPTTIKKKQMEPGSGLYMLNIFEIKNIVIPFRLVGNNLLDILKSKIVDMYEGKCNSNGYIKKNSIRIISYSSGEMRSGNCIYNVNVEALICNPVEGMIMKVIVNSITKAGINARTKNESPIDVFILRDQMNKLKSFNNAKKDDEIIVKVIGTRFELNDEKISVIGQILKKKD
jgi:DNA-directed RNA polymerase subunit E'/Rpb7